MAEIWLLLNFLMLVAGGQIFYPGQYEKMTIVTSRAPVLSGQPSNYPTLQTISNSQSVQSNRESALQSGIPHSETRLYSTTQQLPLNPSVSPTANSTASLGTWNNHVSYQFVICMFFIFCMLSNANNLS